MIQLSEARRLGWALLAAVALVVSLLAVAASPTGAEIDEADHATRLSACVGDALGDQMFTDVSDEHAFKDDINCIAYYGITSGTGDGSTYSPDRDVTRAEMAVFIARAAGVAGVELGDAGSDEFDDIGGIWQDARDAVNRLAGNGIIGGGGQFRPGDAITRVEMASFLVGLLAAAAPNVAIDSDGAIKLGDSVPDEVADDHFGDVRATKPAAADAQTAALFELGVTKGASPAAGAEDGKAPIDYDYEPDGTVDRGQMAAFITRALAHTSVRPEGVSAQFDGSHVRVSVRDGDFQPVANAVVDVFRIDAASVDAAFEADGSCSVAVSRISDSGAYVCEIDGIDPITGGDGETSVELDGGVDDGGTVVWAWTGDDEDTVGDDTNPYRLDIAQAEAPTAATQMWVGRESLTEGSKARLGTPVVYSVQLQDADGDVNVGIDGENPAKVIVTLSTYTTTQSGARSPGGPSAEWALPLTTDADGKATFTVSGLPDLDPGIKRDKYIVDIHIQPDPDGGNIEAFARFDGKEIPPERVDPQDPNSATTGRFHASSVVFSTEPGARTLFDMFISLESANDFIAASARGAANQATASVLDQYGDPIPGARIWFTSTVVDDNGTPDDKTDDVPTVTEIHGGTAFTVGRDGTYTFGYVRESDSAATETLTAYWDHDGDGCLSSDVLNTALTSWNVFINNNLVKDDQGTVTGVDLNGDGDSDDTGEDSVTDSSGTAVTGPVTWDHDGDSTTAQVPVTVDCYDERPVIDLDSDGTLDQPGATGDTRAIHKYKGTAPVFGIATVEWAEVAGFTTFGGVNEPIRAFDLETDTIFVGSEDRDNDVFVLYYGPNDRFNVGPIDGSKPPVTYASFERALAASIREGYVIDWEITGRGSRAVKEFTLTTLTTPDA